MPAITGLLNANENTAYSPYRCCIGSSPGSSPGSVSIESGDISGTALAVMWCLYLFIFSCILLRIPLSSLASNSVTLLAFSGSRIKPLRLKDKSIYGHYPQSYRSLPRRGFVRWLVPALVLSRTGVLCRSAFRLNPAFYLALFVVY